MKWHLFKIALLIIENPMTSGIMQYLGCLCYISLIWNLCLKLSDYMPSTVLLPQRSVQTSFHMEHFFSHPLTTNTSIFVQKIVLLKDNRIPLFLIINCLLSEIHCYEKFLFLFQQKPWRRAVTESMKKPTSLGSKRQKNEASLQYKLVKKKYTILKKKRVKENG